MAILPSVIGSPAQATASGTASIVARNQGAGAAAKIDGAIGTVQRLVQDDTNRRMAIEAKEQEVLAIDAHNRINTKLGTYQRDYVKTADTKAYGVFNEKFDSFSAETFATETKGLPPKVQQAVKNSMTRNRQMYSNNVTKYRGIQAQIAKNNADQTYFQGAVTTAGFVTPGIGQEDISFNEAVKATFSFYKTRGGGATKESIQSFSSGVKLPDNFMEAPLSETKKIVTEMLKKAKPGSQEFANTSNLLTDINKAIFSEAKIQETKDKIISTRFDRQIQSGDLLSAGMLQENTDAQFEDGNHKASKELSAKMKAIVKNSGDTQRALSNSNFQAREVKIQSTPTKQTKAEFEVNASAGEIKLRKSMKGLSAKIQDKAIRDYRDSMIQYGKVYDSKEKVAIDGYIDLLENNNMSVNQGNAEIDKLVDSGAINSETELKTRKVLANRQKTRLYSGKEIGKQNTVVADTMQVIQDGFYYINGVKYNATTEKEAYNRYVAIGGVGRREDAPFQNLYIRRNKPIVANLLLPALEDAGKSYSWFKENGGIERLQDALKWDQKSTHNPSDYKIALSSVLSSKLTIPGKSRYFSKGYGPDKTVTFSEADSGSDTISIISAGLLAGPSIPNAQEIVYEQGWVVQKYQESFDSPGKKPNYMTKRNPTPWALDRFAKDFKLHKNDSGDYVPSVIKSSNQTIKNFYNLTTTAKATSSELK